MAVAPLSSLQLTRELAWTLRVPACGCERNDANHGALSRWLGVSKTVFEPPQANNVGGVQDESEPKSEPAPGPATAGQSTRPEAGPAAGRRPETRPAATAAAEAWPRWAPGWRSARPAGPEPLM